MLLTGCTWLQAKRMEQALRLSVERDGGSWGDVASMQGFTFLWESEVPVSSRPGSGMAPVPVAAAGADRPSSGPAGASSLLTNLPHTLHIHTPHTHSPVHPVPYPLCVIVHTTPLYSLCLCLSLSTFATWASRPGVETAVFVCGFCAE